MAITGVTKETYSKLASSFMELNGGQGYVIAQRSGQFPLTPQQWDAWRAYLARLGLPLAFMDSRDYYTVPAEWPHLFDAMATVGDDRASPQRPRKEYSASILSTEARKAAVVNRLGYDPSKKRGVWKRDEGVERPLKYTDKEALFKAHDEAVAAAEAKKAAKTTRSAA